FFGGASPAAPASIGTFLDSQSIYDVKREQLLANMAYFENRVQNMSYFKSMKGHPAYTFQDKKLSEYLENNGFILTNFNYPEESTAIMSRIVISSHHLEHDIKLITKAINTYYPG
ncbi:MAG: pyridoxal phosphate-dependent aminotransferase family protein, partial [Maribacter sp.]|nr:pyridoxal phosphate-dependent aminotransferase family protein [Maribacter sp.]